MIFIYVNAGCQYCISEMQVKLLPPTIQRTEDIFVLLFFFRQNLLKAAYQLGNLKTKYHDAKAPFGSKNSFS